MKKAVIITGKFVQDHEFLYPYYRLREDGYDVHVATEDGHDTVGQLGIKIPVDINFSNVEDYEDLASYGETNGWHLIVIPGGAKCMEYLRQNQDVLKFISAFYTTGKIISSICHGAQMLISAKIVKGKKISGYYSIKDDINNAGAEFVDAPVVRDGNIITCPHYKYLGQWMKETIKAVNENTSH